MSLIFRRPFLPVVIMLALLFSGAAQSAAKLKPFVLASTSEVSHADVSKSVRQSLVRAGFKIVGGYVPYPGAYVIAVTNERLQNIARTEKGGIYLAVMRVAVTQVGTAVQVSHNNPLYLQHAYRLKSSLKPVAASLARALGVEKQFGSKRGLTERKLRKYQYTFGMERFTDSMLLASYESQAEALRVLESNLKAKTAGASKVYRLDVPGTNKSIFGVALSEGDGSDITVMDVADFQDLKHSAHLPYEVVVENGDISALNARFRIAISFPDLKMKRKNGFLSLMPAPGATREVLTKVAGGSLNQEDELDF